MDTGPTSPDPEGESEKGAIRPGRTGAGREEESATRRAIAVNTGALVAARFGVAALGWAGTVLIVRSLSLEQWGRFSFVFGLLGLLSVFTDLGVGRVAIKGLLEPGTDRAAFAGTLVVLRAVLGFLGYLLALGVVLVGGYPAEVVRATAVAGLVVVLATPSHALEAVFQVNMQMRTVAVATVLGQISQLALIAAIATSGGSLVLFCIPAIVCEVAILGWKLRGIRRLQPLIPGVDWTTWKRLLKEAAPLAVGTAFATIYFRIDALMLSKLDTFSAVGIYGVAYKFVDLVHYFPTALMVPVLAVLVQAWPNDIDGFGDTFRRAMIMLAIVGGLAAMEFAVFARPVMSALYGDEYAVGAGAGRLVVVAECIASFSGLCFTALVAMGRNRLYPLAALIGVLLNVGLNLWLIPARSYEGAAWATVITEVVVLGILLVPMLRMSFLRPLPVGQLARVVVCAGLAGAVALGGWILLPWPAAAVVAGVAYVGLLHWTRAAGPAGLQDLIRGTVR